MRLGKASILILVFIGLFTAFGACRGQKGKPSATLLQPIQATYTHSLGKSSTPAPLPTQLTYTPFPSITPMPTKAVTATYIYLRYTPKENFIFRFEFEYPSRWDVEFSPDWGLDPSDADIIIYDYSVPGSWVVLTVGRHAIDYINQDMQQIISGAEKEGEILEDKYVNISGYQAHWFLRMMPPQPVPDKTTKKSTTMIELHVSLAVGDDGYMFSLYTPVGEENSQFAQDFRTMILDMKYNP